MHSFDRFFFVFTRVKYVNGELRFLPHEVAVMFKLKGMTEDCNFVVELLDWYEFPDELILVLERPDPCMDLFDYLESDGGYMDVQKAKVFCFFLTLQLMFMH